jgi:hypothetical protein
MEGLKNLSNFCFWEGGGGMKEGLHFLFLFCRNEMNPRGRKIKIQVQNKKLANA